MSTQLTDSKGNHIIPEAAPPSSLAANKVTVSHINGLSSNNAQSMFQELNQKINQGGGGGGGDNLNVKIEIPLSSGINGATGAIIVGNDTYKGLWMTSALAETEYIVESDNVWVSSSGVACYSGEPSTSTFLGVVTLRVCDKYTRFTTLEGTAQFIVSVYVRSGVDISKPFYIYRYDALINRNDVYNDSEFEIGCLKERCNQLEMRNDFAWREYDKGYFSFVADDANPDIGEVADLCIQKGIPLCMAVPRERIRSSVNASTSGNYVYQVMNAVVANGGEILSHSYTVLTYELCHNFEQMYDTFVMSKKALQNAGYEVNGIILAGGQGYETADFNECVKWCRMYYRYADNYGHNTGVVQYDHPRIDVNTTLDRLKERVDTCVQNKTWLVFFTHGFHELSASNMAELFDYINAYVQQGVLGVTNYKDLHDTFGSSKLEQQILNT